jgi:tetratricopeptide (TPR) repeat protein
VSKRNAGDVTENKTDFVGREGVTFSNSIRWAFMLIALCIGAEAVADEWRAQLIFGASGATKARPLSVEWLNYWPNGHFFDNAAGQLVTELVKSTRVDADTWSQRTGAEIRSAISTDDLLSNNAWSTVKCSRNGCIVAIDSLDLVMRTRESSTRIVVFKGRLLAYMTPRRLLSHHIDLAMFESDVAPDTQLTHYYVLFFIFPDRETLDGASSPRQEPQTVSQAIAEDIKLAYAAISSKEWAEAIRELSTAEATKGINAFDQKVIYENQGFAYMRLHDFQAAQEAYQKGLPFAFALSTKDALEDARRLMYVSALNGQYLTAIETGRSLVEHGVASADDMAEISRSYFGAQDCKYAVRWESESVAAMGKTGESPDVSLLNVKSRCERMYGDAVKIGGPAQSFVTH